MCIQTGIARTNQILKKKTHFALTIVLQIRIRYKKKSYPRNKIVATSKVRLIDVTCTRVQLYRVPGYRHRVQIVEQFFVGTTCSYPVCIPLPGFPGVPGTRVPGYLGVGKWAYLPCTGVTGDRPMLLALILQYQPVYPGT